MKKTLKGFTLVELIIVMLIMTILLAAIMQLFKPVRAAYQDAAYLENKRTVCNAISKYMTESLRYAQFIGTYDSSQIGGTFDTGATNAANQLLQNGIVPDTTLELTPVQIDKIAPYMQVICIDYTPVTYNNQKFTGRIYRYKFDSAYNPVSNSFGAPTNSHMSFGEDYYGANTYGISCVLDAGLLTVAASTLGIHNDDLDNDITTADIINGTNSMITSNTAVELRNITTTAAKGKLYFHSTGDSDGDTIPDMLDSVVAGGGNGTLASGGKQYFFAFIPADKLPT
ncbi:MAG: type II secretion system GspH family protein [Ruminococcus sp.]|nr:type II secretion system GspH family protein [Ruminococcus sp.]